jgi:signal transduction histidine kinase
LNISRQIVGAHGGRLFAENRGTAGTGNGNGNGGARFVIRLPAA